MKGLKYGCFSLFAVNYFVEGKFEEDLNPHSESQGKVMYHTVPISVIDQSSLEGSFKEDLNHKLEKKLSTLPTL